MINDKEKDDLLACNTPMSDHVAQFWKLLETEHVRICLDLRREIGHDSGEVSVYWDGSSFSDAVAKALVADRASAQNASAPSATLEEIARVKAGLETIAAICALARIR